MGYNGRRNKPPKSLAKLAHQPRRSLGELVHGGAGGSRPVKANPELNNEAIFYFIAGLNTHLLGYCYEHGLDAKTVAGSWETLFNNVGLAAMQKADGRSLTHSAPYTVDDLKSDLSPYWLSFNWLYEYDAAKKAEPNLEAVLQEEIATRIETLRMRLAVKEQVKSSAAEGTSAAR